MNLLRFKSAFCERSRVWKIKDSKNNAEFGSFDTRFQADKRVDQLNKQESKKKLKDCGMRHPVPAPPPRAYKD